MTWTKNEIVEELMERTGLQRNEVVVIVEGVIEIIKEALIRGDRAVSYTHLTLPTKA